MQYVKEMKGVIASFNATAQRIRADMDRNDRQFAASIAEAENNKLRQQLSAAEIDARNKLDAIHAKAKAAVKAWETPAGDNIDTADLEVLKGNFQLSNSHLKALLVKHQGNGTMVNAIARYAKENSGNFDGYIPNSEDKLYIYKAFTKSAHNFVSNIAGSIGISDNNIGLMLWGEPGNISQRAELVLYGIKAEDEPVPVPSKGFSFNFKHLDGR